MSFHKSPEQSFYTLRFLSLRFSADFRCSRLVSLRAPSKTLLVHSTEVIDLIKFFISFWFFRNFEIFLKYFLFQKIPKLFPNFGVKLTLDKNQGAFSTFSFLISLCFLFKLNFFAAFLETIPYFFRILRIVRLETVFDVEKVFYSTLTRSNVVFGSFSTLRTISLCYLSLSFSSGPGGFFRHIRVRSQKTLVSCLSCRSRFKTQLFFNFFVR